VDVLCKAVIILNEDVARTKSAFEQTGDSERSIPVEGHAIVLAWLMLLGPAEVDPSAKHRPGAAVSYPCLAHRAGHPSLQIKHFL
jgi:hypothetical protein